MTNIIDVEISESILNSIKKLIGLDKDYKQFDVDVVININSSLARLCTLGVGPDEGFRVNGPDQTWSEFLGNSKLFENAKLYVYLKAKLVFDPPQSSAVIQSYKEEIKELEWILESTASTQVKEPVAE